MALAKGLQRVRQQLAACNRALETAEAKREAILTFFRRLEAILADINALQEAPKLLREVDQRVGSSSDAIRRMEQTLLETVVRLGEEMQGFAEAFQSLKSAAEQATVLLPPEITANIQALSAGEIDSIAEEAGAAPLTA